MYMLCLQLYMCACIFLYVWIYVCVYEHLCVYICMRILTPCMLVHCFHVCMCVFNSMQDEKSRMAKYEMLKRHQ